MRMRRIVLVAAAILWTLWAYQTPWGPSSRGPIIAAERRWVPVAAVGWIVCAGLWGRRRDREPPRAPSKHGHESPGDR